MFFYAKYWILPFLSISLTLSKESAFQISSRNNTVKPRVNDPFESLHIEMRNYVKNCKVSQSSEESSEKSGINNNYSRRSIINQNSKEIDDDDASFSSRQYYMSKIYRSSDKGSNNTDYASQQQQMANQYGRNRNTNNENNDSRNQQNFGDNLWRNRNDNDNNQHQNFNNNRRGSCSGNSNQNFDRNNNQNLDRNNNNNYGRNDGNGYSNTDMQNNNYNGRNNYDNKENNNDYFNTRSGTMDRKYSSKMETFLQPSQSTNDWRRYNMEDTYDSRHPVYRSMVYPSRDYNERSDQATRMYTQNDNQNSNNYYTNRNEDGENGRDFVRDYYPQTLERRENSERYPRSSGNLQKWNKKEENVECIARCIFGYLDVLNEDKAPSEVSLIKWLQDHENDSNKRIKALRKIRRCYARLSTSGRFLDSTPKNKTKIRCIYYRYRRKL